MSKMNEEKTDLKEQVDKKQFHMPRILIVYDMLVYLIAAVLLLVLYEGNDKLTTSGIFQQVVLSAGCIFAVRMVGKIYGQVWRYGGIQCYIRLLSTDAIAFIIYLLMELCLPVEKITFARGRWIAFLDSDDVWVPEKLEKQLRFMQERDYAFTYTDYRIQLNGEWLPYINTAPNCITKKKMYDYCYFSTITVMYDQSKVGLIQIADLKKNNDYAMWLKAVEKVKCYRLPECLSYYIKHDGSISSGSKFKLIRWHYLLFRKGMDMNPVLSSVLTLNNLFHGVLKKIIYKKKVDE